MIFFSIFHGSIFCELTWKNSIFYVEGNGAVFWSSRAVETNTSKMSYYEQFHEIFLRLQVMAIHWHDGDSLATPTRWRLLICSRNLSVIPRIVFLLLWPKTLRQFFRNDTKTVIKTILRVLGQYSNLLKIFF